MNNSDFHSNLEKVKKLISEEEIRKKIVELANQVNNDFKNSSELVVIGVLKGSMLFVADLIRHIDIPLQLEFVRLASYGDEQKSSGKVKPVDLTLPNLEGKDVLVVEDIVDTGLTANFFVDYLKYHHKPKNLKLMSFLDKPSTRTHTIYIDYVGFEIQNQFVIGYGLDYAGFYRNLPYVGYIE